MDSSSVNRYVGRFAPSPTGDLHFGSLVAALASYLQAKKSAGKWVVRVEDIDPPREKAGSADRIIKDLGRLGMKSDGPVVYQRHRQAAYDLAVAQLVESKQAYWCACSRKDLPSSGIYPGTCRDGISRGKLPRAVRVRVNSTPVAFLDRLQGKQIHNLLESVGDFVIRRVDGMTAYQLAVVVDDAFQNVSEVVRGADLLDSTARQIWLQTCLKLPSPAYLHIPIAVSQDGSKLSKRYKSDPIRHADPARSLQAALAFLGHEAPRLGLADTLGWALENWSVSNIPSVIAHPV